MKRVVALLASCGLLVSLATSAPASAATAPSATAVATFTNELSSTQQHQFTTMSTAQKNEMVAAFDDPSVFENAYTPAQLAATYPNLQTTDSTGADSADPPVSDPPVAGPPVNGGPPLSAPALSSSAATPSYTTYSVHSWYHHTVCELWLCNTASLDYYYYTGNNRVLSSRKCTWHDSGFSFPLEITNITTSESISSGNGHCDADVQLTELYHLTNGYLLQNMSVNYHGIYSKYFKQVGP